jgi:tetratricopeptide (TPR) repeat protein
MPTVPAARSPLLPRIIVLLCLAVVLALLGWIFSQVKIKKDHWDELARARSYLDRGQPDLAIQAVSGIRDDGPGAAEGLTLAGRAFLMRGNIAPARRVLEGSLKLKRAQPEAAKMLAAIYLAAGDGQRAITLLKDAARLEPGDFRPWYALGKVYHDLGNLEDSAGAYAEALRRTPPAAEARESRIGRVRALLDAHRGEEASAELAVLSQQTPDDPQVLALAARQARDLGRPDAAAERAQRALAGDPTNFDALLVRARLRALSRQPERAIEDLEKALVEKPHDRAALQLLAQVQMSAGLNEKARATQERANRSRQRIELMDRLAKVIDQHPEDPEPRWRMGQAAMDGEMYVLAYQCFQAALYLDPNFKPAHDALEALRSRKGFDPSSITGPQIPPLGKPRAQGP